MKSHLVALYRERFGRDPQALLDLRADGSDRVLYRLLGDEGTSVVGVFGPDHEENRAFLSFSRSLRAAGLPVPEIYAADEPEGIYLEEDLGNTTLFDMLTAARGNGREFPENIVPLYERVVELLPRVQVAGGRVIDFAHAYPCAEFDRRSMMWDLSYFKYHFLKLARIPFNEARLEEDFTHLCDVLLAADRTHFLYRDFQSRNIMIREGDPWLIDYQGGRRGAVHYDIASLLYDAKADLPDALRNELLDRYMAALAREIPVDTATFRPLYRGYVLIRILQAMGAYGYRGFFERKAHFLASVPYAVRNIAGLLHAGLPVRLPELEVVLGRVVDRAGVRGDAGVGGDAEVAGDAGRWTLDAGGEVVDAGGEAGKGIDEQRELTTGSPHPAGKAEGAMHEHDQTLSRSARVAGSDVAGSGVVSDNEDISEGGAVRPYLTDSEGRNVDPLEHRRGVLASNEGGVPALPADSSRLVGGTGNTTHPVGTSELHREGRGEDALDTRTTSGTADQRAAAHDLNKAELAEPSMPSAERPASSVQRPEKGTEPPVSDTDHQVSDTPDLEPSMLSAERPASSVQRPENHIEQPALHLHISSFSFKRGYPADATGHGGGFVFDCRALHNPGRYAEYREATGLDAPVIEFLEQVPELEVFFESVHAMVAASVAVYRERGFTDLSVAFGCTGGRHRSVYMAERLSRRLREQFADIVIDVRHHEEGSAWHRSPV